MVALGYNEQLGATQPFEVALKMRYSSTESKIEGANFPDFPLRFGGAINYNKHKASKYTAGNRYCAGKRREETR